MLSSMINGSTSDIRSCRDSYGYSLIPEYWGCSVCCPQLYASLEDSDHIRESVKNCYLEKTDQLVSYHFLWRRRERKQSLPPRCSSTTENESVWSAVKCSEKQVRLSQVPNKPNFGALSTRPLSHFNIYRHVCRIFVLQYLHGFWRYFEQLYNAIFMQPVEQTENRLKCVETQWVALK